MYEPDRDQWLSDGICSKCRRQKFCSKPCKRHKGAVQQEIVGLMTTAMIKTMVGGVKKRRDDV